MKDVKAVLWTGGDAPNRQAELTVTHDDYLGCFTACWQPGYCGCEDCRPIIGCGSTAAEAIEDYWELWEDHQL